MIEPTIICPKCKTEILLTESLAAPLVEATRQQFEEKLSKKDEEIAQREQVLRDKEGSAQESVKGRDFREFCLRAGIGYSRPDARQRLDAGIGVAGLQGLPA